MGQNYGQAFLWAGILTAAIVAAWMILLHVARLLRKTPPASRAEPWTLHELRHLLKTGQISQQEFERLRSKLLDRVSGGRAGMRDESAPASGAASSPGDAEASPGIGPPGPPNQP